MLNSSRLSQRGIPNSLPRIERRSTMRYPVRINVRYRVLGGARNRAGTGQALNISRGGILIQADPRFRPTLIRNAPLEVTFEWPLQLNGATPLKTVVLGVVARFGSDTFAVSIQHYRFEFRSRIIRDYGAA